MTRPDALGRQNSRAPATLKRALLGHGERCVRELAGYRK